MSERKRKRTRKSSEHKELQVPKKLPTRSASEMSAVRSYIIYGRSNTGKTTLASTFPKPALLLDCRDKGTDSIADVKGIEVMDVNEWDDFEIAYWYLKKNPKKFKTVIIDTASGLQQIAIEKSLKDKRKSTKNAGDWGTMTKRDWGDVSQLMKIWIINWRDLPMNVVFIAQDRVFNFDEELEDDTNDHAIDPEVGPGLSPSIAKALNAAVSVIGNTFIRQRRVKKKVKGKTKSRRVTEYCLRIGPNPVYITKVRKPRDIVPPAILVDPRYEDIINLVKGS